MLGTLDVLDAAHEAAGNWKQFDCFCWFRASELDDADNWSVIYTHHRDSGLLDQSNAAAIAETLSTFTEADNPDIVFETHSHWAVGHVDGFSIRVFRNGQITDAFRAYHALTEQLADYPILNEDDCSNREYEATLQNVVDSAWRLKHEFELPEGWESEVYSWLSDHNCSAIENRDDLGGYPDEGDLKAALLALGYLQAD
jgi:hypothetical protein